jgi:hypothetical protein
LVNDCDFARDSDFKHAFEDLLSMARRIAAAFGLTQTDTMLYKMGAEPEGHARDLHVRTIVATSLILVSRRTAGGG